MAVWRGRGRGASWALVIGLPLCSAGAAAAPGAGAGPGRPVQDSAPRPAPPSEAGAWSGPPSEWVRQDGRSRAQAALAERRARFEALRTPEDVAAWQESARRALHRALGPLPEPRVLSARTVGRLEAPRCVAEKVLLETRPGFFVSATLYLPPEVSGPGSVPVSKPVPGVLIPCGHSQNGKAEPKYQLAAMSLAAHGMVALCFDPVGQGERKQGLDEDGRPFFHATEEHVVLGAGCVLLGGNLASWMLHDARCALSYLAARPEVDPQRLGCTGNSGGGTQTAYLMADDDRVLCAAPSCSLTGFESLLSTIGPQDSEQNLFAQVAAGMDHADFLHLRAPRPTLLCAATRDFFPIEGTRACFAEARLSYGLLGAAEAVDMVEVEATHGFHRPLRDSMVRWMLRWLADSEASVEEEGLVDEEGLVPFAELDLLCTSRGQVLLEEGARSMLELQREQAEAAARARGLPPVGPRREAELQRRVGEWANLNASDLGPPRLARMLGPFERGDVKAERLLLEAPGEVPLPALLFPAKRAQGQAARGTLLWLDAAGKDADLPGITARQAGGWTVLAVDLRGVGELRSAEGRGDYARHAGPNWGEVFTDQLLGRSWVGLRAHEILHLVRWVQDSAGPGDDGLFGPALCVRATGSLGSAALHAAVLERAIQRLELVQALRSWDEVVDHPRPARIWEEVVHGVLHAYDLPDLRAALGPRLLEQDPRGPGG